jgi:hypothetical protein
MLLRQFENSLQAYAAIEVTVQVAQGQSGIDVGYRIHRQAILVIATRQVNERKKFTHIPVITAAREIPSIIPFFNGSGAEQRKPRN